MRIVIALPCCIGDVIMATAALAALRQAHPSAHIAWLVGGWSRAALAGHPALDALIDSGPAANPLKTPGGFAHTVRLLRATQADLLVSFMRSPLMSAAALLSGIPMRAGLDSGGRGFGYTQRARVDPAAARHEAEIYLDVVRALGIDPAGARAFIPAPDQARAAMRARLDATGITAPFVVVHPGGGRNPGATLDAKRYPPDSLAALADALAADAGAALVLIGAPSDGPLVDALSAALNRPSARFTDLHFAEVAALGADAHLYIGNDTGMTHLAAAAGARTIAIFGPTDPRRYAPFNEDVLALWRPVAVPAHGAAGGAPPAWEWARDGLSPAEAIARARAWVGR